MRLPGYGVPSAATLQRALEPQMRWLERCLRDWCASPTRRSLRPLVEALAGLALLSRLYGRHSSLANARRLLRTLQHRSGQQRPAIVRQYLTLLDEWAERPIAAHYAGTCLTLLRESSLGALRMPGTDGAAVPGTARHYQALRLCLDHRTTVAASEASICRLLLEDERATQCVEHQFTHDVALCMDGPLERLGRAVVDRAGTDHGGEPCWRISDALYRLYRELSVLASARQLRCVALPAAALHQGMWLIVLHLRHPVTDWAQDGLDTLVRHLLALQCWLMTEPRSPGPELSPVLRQTGRLLRDWRRAPGLAGATMPGLDAAVAGELRSEAWHLARSASAGVEQAVPPSLCASLSRLHLTLHLTPYRTLAWWADSLQQSLLVRLQRGHCLGPVWLRRLQRFRQAVLAGPVCERAGTQVSGSGPFPDHCLLETVTDEARLLTRQQRRMARKIPLEPAAGAVREPPGDAREGVVQRLSGGLSRLGDPESLLRTLTTRGDEGERTELLRTVAGELALLEDGARVLGVPRIEALAAVLGRVYRQVSADSASFRPGPDRDLWTALRRGHAGLLHRLDQAAAWQAISRPQPVIEYLYRFLETRRSGRSRDALMVPQRCLAINRRLLALLETAPAGAASRERSALMATLIRDQARLLRTLAAAHRNQTGQRV